MIKMRTVFTGRNWEEASMNARLSGYVVVGKARNPKGEYVVFAEKASKVFRF